MRKRLSIIAAGLLAVGLASPAWANAPAPWWSCEGKAAGDTCELYPAGQGLCEVQAECTDETATEVDECLWCEGDPSGCSTTGSAPAGLSALLVLGAALGLRRRRR